MKKGIHDLAYLIKQAKENGEPKPIVVLGAGVSVSGGIPMASGIIKDILKTYKDKPSIKNLPKEKKEDYYELMSALTSKERKELFQEYIKEAKVNVAHIYLAQLVKLGYIDYVLTVNFDDLLLRACGLFNYTMPTYDISNVKDFTTTTFQKQSIVYLHGQHYGEWLLNAKGELDKVRGQVPILLNKICHNRTWIVVGYSGQDEVFDELNNFSSFDNDLYWVGYLDKMPNNKVEKEMLQVSTKNAHLISGYDADTFFLDLHSKLKLPTPQIFDKPFSFLNTMLSEVQIPDEDKRIDNHKDLYNSLSERMEISNDWVARAINDIEEEDSVERFKQQIIEAYVKEEFEQNEAQFLEKFKSPKFNKAKSELADFYFSWGLSLHKSVNYSTDNQKLKLSYEKYEKSIELKPENGFAYYNSGTTLLNLARLESDEKLYELSFEKFKKAIDLIPENSHTYYNYGLALMDLARLKSDAKLYERSFEQFEKVLELNPERDSGFYSYGIALSGLANIKFDEKLYELSFKQFEKALELNPEKDLIYYSYGNALSSLAKQKSDEKLYKRSFEQFKKALELNPEKGFTYERYGNALSNLAKQKSDEELFELSFVQFKKAIELNPNDQTAHYNFGSAILGLYHLNNDYTLIEKNALDVLLKAYSLGGSAYNLSCAYSLLNDKENALKYLDEVMKKSLVSKEFVLKDEDWQNHIDDEDFKALLAKY